MGITKVCEKCEETFKKTTFYRHKKTCNGKPKMKKPKSSTGEYLCFEENCSFESRLRNNFLKHLKESHKIYSEEESKEFANFSEFENWKEEYEKLTTAYFSLRFTKRYKNGSYVKHFVCNRSGHYTSVRTGKRAVKAQGLQKVGHKCTACIHAAVLKGTTKVLVTLFGMHYGHDHELAHLRISKSDRKKIANQLSMGLKKSRVMRNIFAGSGNQSLERRHLTKHQDLKNIRASLGLEKFEKTRRGGELISVDDFVAEDLLTEKSIFLYKKQGVANMQVPKNEQSALEVEDFVLGIMTSFQKSMLESFGNNILCFDATHRTNSYDFVLVTLLVLDDFNEGIPVAWMISNKETYMVLTLFLSKLKEQVRDLNPRVIITDKIPQYYLSFVDTFNGSPRKLLCHWLVQEDWQKNMSKIRNSKRSTVLKSLCALLEEVDTDKFNVLLGKCLESLYMDSDTTEFAQYFEYEWISCREDWAKCFRVGNEMNMESLESFHKSLKSVDKCFKGKLSKNMDRCVSILSQFAEDVLVQRLQKLEEGRITWRTTIVNRRHRTAEDLPLTSVTRVSSETWEVKSEKPETCGTASAESSNYTVLRKPVCKKNCKVRCKDCNICVHSYSCNCPDGLLMSTICVHIHLVVRSVPPDEVFEETDNYGYAMDVSQSDSVDHHESAVDHTAMLFREFSNAADLTNLKSDLMSKMNSLFEMVQNCHTKDLLLKARSHIANATTVLESCKNKNHYSYPQECRPPTDRIVYARAEEVPICEVYPPYM